MKRAYIVCGPESSGNRMVASLLIAAGCAGGTAFDHPLMFELPTTEDPVVIVRSYPHGNDWPDLVEIHDVLRRRGYMVRVLVSVRDPHCVVESQIASRHHPRQLAWSNYQRAYRELFAQLLRLNVWFTLVPYSALALRGGAAAASLLASLELPNASIEFRDENWKYYA